ncbi:MAG: hypothetical protein Fur0015_01810 [Ignavibacteriales bacterium]
MNVDFMVGGAQKWLMSLEGLSYLFCKSELINKLNPIFAGWTSVDDAWNCLIMN